jgi:hypothetical protein
MTSPPATPRNSATEPWIAPAARVATTFHDQWVAELTRLEADVTLAESVLRTNEAPVLPAWERPRVRGPLPTDLEDRARLVLERQLAVAHRLTQRLTATGKERALHQRLRDTAHPDVPVYVDIDA